MPSNEKSSSSGSLGANKQAVIIDLDQRRRAVLAELDNAKFSYVFFRYLSSLSILTLLQMVPC
jgi:hypothetical protein